MTDVTIRGADDFADLARRIHQHADKKALQKELYSGLNRATKGVREEMKDSLGEGLPQSGGLAAKFKRESGLQARARGGRGAAVRIITGRRHDFRSLEAGILRHPVFGDRKTWVSQPVSSGLLSTPFMESKPDIQRDLQRVMAELARKVEG